MLVRTYIIDRFLTRYSYYGKQYGNHLHLLGITHKKYNPYCVKICVFYVHCGVSHSDAQPMETNQMSGMNEWMKRTNMSVMEYYLSLEENLAICNID